LHSFPVGDSDYTTLLVTLKLSLTRLGFIIAL
jgi:hypothetical protein